MTPAAPHPADPGNGRSGRPAHARPLQSRPRRAPWPGRRTPPKSVSLDRGGLGRDRRERRGRRPPLRGRLVPRVAQRRVERGAHVPDRQARRDRHPRRAAAGDHRCPRPGGASATHGCDLYCAEGKAGDIPAAVFAAPPYPMLPSPFSIHEPYVGLQKMSASFFDAAFAGQTPVVKDFPTPLRDFDGDGKVDDKDGSLSTPTSDQPNAPAPASWQASSLVRAARRVKIRTSRPERRH